MEAVPNPGSSSSVPHSRANPGASREAAEHPGEVHKTMLLRKGQLLSEPHFLIHKMQIIIVSAW